MVLEYDQDERVNGGVEIFVQQSKIRGEQEMGEKQPEWKKGKRALGFPKAKCGAPERTHWEKGHFHEEGERGTWSKMGKASYGSHIRLVVSTLMWCGLNLS